MRRLHGQAFICVSVYSVRYATHIIYYICNIYVYACMYGPGPRAGGSYAYYILHIQYYVLYIMHDTCLYVCMYVCMYVCICMYMCSCMYACMHEYGCIHACARVRMRLYVCMYACTNEWCVKPEYLVRAQATVSQAPWEGAALQRRLAHLPLVGRRAKKTSDTCYNTDTLGAAY